ncbi:hypothetical protein CA13_41120 [Planctomycetes bacterium CA13]|uniref:Uncharacterized protein n=1 Tax=Novipirellula herctigrandis TaxID=2527986 RepID=A0A5C5Z5I2_9BACT|nr:hypothetical protein CA13_41120 [Planctomycetes bacterium CA13]
MHLYRIGSNGLNAESVYLRLCRFRIEAADLSPGQSVLCRIGDEKWQFRRCGGRAREAKHATRIDFLIIPYADPSATSVSFGVMPFASPVAFRSRFFISNPKSIERAHFI